MARLKSSSASASFVKSITSVKKRISLSSRSVCKQERAATYLCSAASSRECVPEGDLEAVHMSECLVFPIPLWKPDLRVDPEMERLHSKSLVPRTSQRASTRLDHVRSVT